MSSHWARSCRYGPQWSRGPINLCCFSWRNVWQPRHHSCGLTARSTPSLATRGRTRMLVCPFKCVFQTRSFIASLRFFFYFCRCLLESMRGNSVFLPRYHSSAVTLYLQSFKFGLGGEVRGWTVTAFKGGVHPSNFGFSVGFFTFSNRPPFTSVVATLLSSK